MKIKTTAKELKAALNLIAPAINPRSHNRAMTCAVFDGLTIRGTNGDIQITTPFGLNVSGENIGGFAVDFARLKSLASSVGGETAIAIDVGEGDAIVRFGRSRYKLATVNPNDIPAFSAVSGDTYAPTPDFASRIAFSLSHRTEDATRPSLCGVKIDGAKICGTDGKMLGWSTLNDDSGLDLILPQPACLAIIASGNPNAIRADKNLVEFEFENITLKSRLIDMQYPDWERAIPTDGDASFEVSNSDFKASVKRLMDFASSGLSPRITFVGDGSIIALGSLDGDGRMAHEIILEGDGLPVFSRTLAGKMILDACDAHSQSNYLKITTNSVNQSALLTFSGVDGFQSLLFPMHHATSSMPDDILSEIAGDNSKFEEAA